MNEAAHFLQFFFVNELQRIEILDFGGDLGGKLRGVEVGNACYAAFARQQAGPHFWTGITHAADQSHAGDDYAASHGHASIFRFIVLGNPWLRSECEALACSAIPVTLRLWRAS